MDRQRKLRNIKLETDSGPSKGERGGKGRKEGRGLKGREGGKGMEGDVDGVFRVLSCRTPTPASGFRAWRLEVEGELGFV